MCAAVYVCMCVFVCVLHVRCESSVYAQLCVCTCVCICAWWCGGSVSVQLCVCTCVCICDGGVGALCVHVRVHVLCGVHVCRVCGVGTLCV